MNTKKELKQKYKETPKQRGIFLIKNSRTGKVFIDSSPDLGAIKNRFIFQLRLGSHKNRELQREWNEYGEESFSFEVLEQLKPDDKGSDYQDKLRKMLEKWRTSSAET